MVERAGAAQDSGPVHPVLDDFVRGFGFNGLGEHWAEISPSDATAVARHVLRKDLAYGAPLMPEEEATALAQGFVGLFDGTVRCFTNGNSVLPAADPRSVPHSDSPISAATFDTGVVCLAASRTGILWVEDED